MSKESENLRALPDKSAKNSVKNVLLRGVFWRILAIEGILLLWSVFYMAMTEDGNTADLFWYAVRILLLVGIIIIFMMVSLRKFLALKVISSLEAIADANKRLKHDDSSTRDVVLPADTPKEIREIAESRKQMLDTIFKVSEERLRLMNFIKDTFGRYLSKKVVDEILASPEGHKIGGQRKTVTILMSDLRGFTYMSESNEPEKIVALLNRHLEGMSEVILSYGGIIGDFIGDAILSIFGSPEKHEDDPERAVACGIAMQNTLAELNQEFVREGYPPLEMGIGINTGTVIIGNIGSEIRTKYDIVGNAVNVASRIESNTTGGEVFIGESTYQQVKSLVVVDKAHTVMMKGLKRPLVYYSVEAIGTPHNVKLQFTVGNDRGTEIRLPFHYWLIEDEKIHDEVMNGETLMITENTITATVDRPLHVLTNIMLKFNFCRDAHCFDEIYAKVTTVENSHGEDVARFTITSIHPADRDVLKKWITAASRSK